MFPTLLAGHVRHLGQQTRQVCLRSSGFLKLTFIPGARVQVLGGVFVLHAVMLNFQFGQK